MKGDAKTVSGFSKFSPQLIKTKKNNNLQLKEDVLKTLEAIKSWSQYSNAAVKTVHQEIKEGFGVLFLELTAKEKIDLAGLVGKYAEKNVYRIDVSILDFKNVQDISKSWDILFATAKIKNRVLLFDEADALFGKRAGVRDTHVNYAKTDLSYLLHKIDDFGLLAIINCSNKAKINTGVLKRFNAIIHPPVS